jgi:hypothetical protein
VTVLLVGKCPRCGTRITYRANTPAPRCPRKCVVAVVPVGAQPQAPTRRGSCCFSLRH